ncbi:MAG: RnfABCDGE type electron transport complex subunit G [Bacteroidales bacterium]|nr:RnfABCDGE type electron transport complex subunit G [Bacteroidales bacterium]
MAKKLDSTLPNMILSLVIISIFMSAALAFVYLKTKEPIENAARQKEAEAIKQVVPAFDSNPATGKIEKGGIVVYQLTNQSIPVGFAVKSSTEKGFGGHIEIMAGFLPDGSIYNITVLQHKETPGLGTKMNEPKFSAQFPGNNPANFSLKVKKDGGQVDAITAATISSRAYCDAVQRAYDALKQVTDSITTQP